eukprot:CAMPEP_0118703650 /NCGR_PEP_ID=MMETSP0800-20121206/18697_1 /TAXON_ID=210618 ORGANISM="Striatella unipunctata, Strain CCMP2910" /NCGR_SAMPLE_ID=MMETSP0800 /ASSEMBLY_ACC=CAM_ASM_000638 /LENGTH=123 /DNA_ID=CAMNT_0006605251 /DNA_START=383 /DNA_END=751 /DNA_ORIENTATION=-
MTPTQSNEPNKPVNNNAAANRTESTDPKLKPHRIKTPENPTKQPMNHRTNPNDINKTDRGSSNQNVHDTKPDAHSSNQTLNPTHPPPNQQQKEERHNPQYSLQNQSDRNQTGQETNPQQTKPN